VRLSGGSIRSGDTVMLLAMTPELRTVRLPGAATTAALRLRGRR
jgi:hypothetical protein